MNSLVRTLLIWLIVMAVPAQGAAAVNMAFCGPTHHGSSAAVAGQPSETANLDHHAATALDPSTASLEPAQQVAAHDTCSACASCCLGGAIPSAGLAVPASAVASTVFSALMATVDAFATDGPDRPPRLVLA